MLAVARAAVRADDPAADPAADPAGEVLGPVAGGSSEIPIVAVLSANGGTRQRPVRWYHSIGEVDRLLARSAGQANPADAPRRSRFSR